MPHQNRRQRYQQRAIDRNADGWSIEKQKAADAMKEREEAEKKRKQEELWVERGVTDDKHKSNDFWNRTLCHQIKKEIENRFFKYKKTKKEYIATSQMMPGSNSPEKRKNNWEGYPREYHLYNDPNYHHQTDSYDVNYKFKNKKSLAQFVKEGMPEDKKALPKYYLHDTIEEYARTHYKHHGGKLPQDMENYDITQILKGNHGVSPDGGDVSEDSGVSADAIKVDVGPDVKKQEAAGRRRRRKSRKKRRKSRRGRKSRRKSKKSRRKRRRTRRRRR